ncbi:MAG: DNA mismatch repair protein MutS, partial [Nitrososphaerota archaeon]|nr:DNA mismatch repair protein MutS [Nitrososphaerota archaeon]
MSEEDVDSRTALPFFRDLNLDQVLQTLTEGREEYNLAPFFCYPLNDVESITYRQDVMKDLEGELLRGHVESFAGEMQEMRRHL